MGSESDAGMAAETAEAVYSFYEDAIPEWGISYILLAEDEFGDVYFPTRPIIEALGVQRTRQTGIIQEDTRTRGGVREISAPTRGGKQKALYIRKRELAIWLTIIDPAYVGQRARGRLTEFQAALWHLAEKLIFKRRQGLEAGLANPTSVATLSGAQRAETTCPDCGAPLIAEVEDGELRLTHK